MLKLKNIKIPYSVYLTLLIAFAAILRFYRIAELPAGMHVDEAGMAYDAFSIANYGVERYLNKFPVYLINYGSGQSALYAYLCAFFIKIMGLSIYAIRLPAFLSGMCVVIFGSLIAKDTLGKRASLLAAFLLSICPYYMMASRFGFDCNLLLGFSTISIYLLVKAIQTSKKKYMILSGLFFGITLYSYSLSWVILPLFLILILSYLLYMKQITFSQIVMLGIPIFIFALPLMGLIYINMNGLDAIVTPFFTIPVIPNFRSDGFSLSNIVLNRNLLTMLLTQDQYIFNSFDHFYTMYLISIPFVIGGILIGGIRFVRSIIKKEFDLSSTIFLFFIAEYFCGLIITNPDIYRMNGIYFSLLYFVVLSIETILKKIKWKKAILSIFILIYAVQSFFFIRFYFRDYESTYPIQWFFNDHITEIFERLEDANLENDIYVDNYNCALYIYDMLVKETSPYEFSSKNEINGDVRNLSNVHYALPEPSEIREDCIYIVFEQNGFQNYLNDLGFTCEKYGYYSLYYHE